MTAEEHLRLARLIDANPEFFTEKFAKAFPGAIKVWEAFVEEAFKVRARGFHHYSARTILHFLRHHTAVAESGSGFKVSDHHSPYFARLFDLRYPSAAGMWSFAKFPGPTTGTK